MFKKVTRRTYNVLDMQPALIKYEQKKKKKKFA